jgi:hypothetical protein
MFIIGTLLVVLIGWWIVSAYLREKAYEARIELEGEIAHAEDERQRKRAGKTVEEWDSRCPY